MADGEEEFLFGNPGVAGLDNPQVKKAKAGGSNQQAKVGGKSRAKTRTSNDDSERAGLLDASNDDGAVLANWDSDRLATWLSSLRLKESYGKILRAGGVDGAALAAMAPRSRPEFYSFLKEMKELGFKVGDAAKIAQALQKHLGIQEERRVVPRVTEKGGERSSNLLRGPAAVPQVSRGWHRSKVREQQEEYDLGGAPGGRRGKLYHQSYPGTLGLCRGRNYAQQW